MVFVCLNPDIAPLDEWLGKFPDEVAEFPLEEYRFHTRSSRLVACNWKTYGDNFMEGYHLPTVHPAMSRDADALHYEVIIKGDPRWNIHVMPPRDESTFGVFGWFWPTFAFDVFPGGFAVERWLPRGHDHSELIFEYFFADDAPDVEAIVKFSEEVADEDVAGVRARPAQPRRRQLRRRASSARSGSTASACSSSWCATPSARSDILLPSDGGTHDRVYGDTGSLDASKGGVMAAWPGAPVVYELNTAAWLHDVGERAGRGRRRSPPCRTRSGTRSRPTASTRCG